MAQHSPVESIAVRWVARQGGCTQIAHSQAGLGGLCRGIQQGALQSFARELPVSTGQLQ